MTLAHHSETRAKIFVSIGATHTKPQRRFVDALIEWIRAEGLDPVVFGKTVYPCKQPLRDIQETMVNCDGTLVVAYERIFVKDGVEKRGADATKLTNQAIATPWNQIEAAMAYAMGQPILVLTEEGIKCEGLLEHGYDWMALSVKIGERAIRARAFEKTLRRWFELVKQHKTMRESREKETGDGNVLGAMPVSVEKRSLMYRRMWEAWWTVTKMMVCLLILAFFFFLLFFEASGISVGRF